MSVVKEAVVKSTDLRRETPFIRTLRTIYPGLVDSSSPVISTETPVPNFDTGIVLNPDSSNQTTEDTSSFPVYSADQYQVPNPTEENIRDRFFSALATTRFGIYPDRTDSEPVYRPEIVGREDRQKVLNAIAGGHIGTKHIEAVVSMLPSSISLYNTRSYPHPPDSPHPQIVESIEVARNMRLNPNHKVMFFLLKGIISEMSLDRNGIRVNRPFDINRITENKALKDISDVTLGAILRTFVLLDCSNAYKFYKLTDNIMEKYNIDPASEPGKRVKNAAFAFSEIVYGEQNQWAIIGRQLIQEGADLAKAAAVRQKLESQFLAPVSQPITENFSNNKTQPLEQPKQVGLFHKVKQKTLQLWENIKSFQITGQQATNKI